MRICSLTCNMAAATWTLGKCLLSDRMKYSTRYDQLTSFFVSTVKPSSFKMSLSDEENAGSKTEQSRSGIY